MSATEGPYDIARTLSEYFGSRSGEGQEPEGSMVRINLGQLDDYYLDEANQLAARPVEDLEQEREVLAQIQEGRPSGWVRRYDETLQKERPSRLRRGLGRLAERVGGWFDRDRGEQVAERVAPPVDELEELRAREELIRKIQPINVLPQ